MRAKLVYRRCKAPDVVQQQHQNPMTAGEATSSSNSTTTVNKAPQAEVTSGWCTDIPFFGECLTPMTLSARFALKSLRDDERQVDQFGELVERSQTNEKGEEEGGDDGALRGGGGDLVSQLTLSDEEFSPSWSNGGGTVTMEAAA
jgi:hypothetical protein